jgi:hypothetical protein
LILPIRIGFVPHPVLHYDHYRHCGRVNCFLVTRRGFPNWADRRTELTPIRHLRPGHRNQRAAGSPMKGAGHHDGGPTKTPTTSWRNRAPAKCTCLVQPTGRRTESWAS